MSRIKSELQRALTTTGDGSALVPQNQLDTMLHEELMKLQPLASLMDVLQAEGLTHEYRTRTSHPYGWFEGETTPSNAQNGVYARKTVQMKIQRIWGSVTGFAQKVDEKFINALAEEITGSIEGMANLFEYGALYGIADDIGFTGDAYQFSGMLPRLYAYAPANVVDAGGNKIELADLDLALAHVTKYRQVRNDPKLWFMGLRMKQVVDGLQTKVQLPLQSVTLADGKIEMAGYGGAAILETDYLVPDAVTTSPTPSGAAAAGGTVPDGIYTYRLASVTLFGEQEGSVASGNVTLGTGNNKTNLTWTADANAKAYMVFRKKSTDTAYSLIDIINAKTYDANGTVNGTRATYTDDGAKAAIAVKPLEAGEQQILLADLNPTRGAAWLGMIDDMGRSVDSMLTFVELARVKDSFDYMIKGYNSLRLVYPNLVGSIRHAKLI